MEVHREETGEEKEQETTGSQCQASKHGSPPLLLLLHLFLLHCGISSRCGSTAPRVLVLL